PGVVSGAISEVKDRAPQIPNIALPQLPRFNFPALPKLPALRRFVTKDALDRNRRGAAIDDDEDGPIRQPVLIGRNSSNDVIIGDQDDIELTYQNDDPVPASDVAFDDDPGPSEAAMVPVGGESRGLSSA